MDAEERQHIGDLIERHKRRLRELEKQAASRGLSTPPEINTEMQDIRGAIANLQKRLQPTSKSVSPLKLPTTPATEEAQAVINAAKTGCAPSVRASYLVRGARQAAPPILRTFASPLVGQQRRFGPR